MKISANSAGIDLEITEADEKFMQKVSSHNFFGIFGDQIAKWRWQNAIRIVGKASAIATKNNIELNIIPSKFLQQVIDASSLDEDDNLQNMWANLLVNKSCGVGVNILYVDILKSLEPIEAELIQELYLQSNDSIDEMFNFSKILVAKTAFTDINLRVVVHKLYGFNILRPPLMKGISVGRFSPALETTDEFHFSELGLDFCKKCNGVEE